MLAFETHGRYEEQCGSLPVFESFGMHAEHLDHDGVHEKEPALSHRTNHGLFFADNRQVEPDSLTRGLVKRCTELGVEIQENTRVETFRRTGAQVSGVVAGDGRHIDGDASYGGARERLTSRLNRPGIPPE